MFCWLPPVTKGNYEKLIDRFIAEYHGDAGSSGSSSIDGVLAANPGTVHRLMGVSGLRLAGDISLNFSTHGRWPGMPGLGWKAPRYPLN